MTAPIAATPLLDVQGLTVGFTGLDIVHGVDFSINAGEILALVGESGCGKSMTAFALARLLPQGARIRAGSVMFRGADLAQLPPREMRALRGRNIAIVQQDPMTSLNPVLSIGYQIEEMIRRHEPQSRTAARRRAIELLALVGIAEPARRIDAFPHQLSGGMRQRVMIAMAVACRPQLLIADEPTTALDVTIQAQVLQLLDRLRRDLNMAMLFITHDLGMVAQWADRVMVMYAGRVVEQAPTRPFFSNPLHPYTIGLLNAAVGYDTHRHYTTDRLTEIAGSVASAAHASGCTFAPRCPRVTPACAASRPKLERKCPAHDAACIVVPVQDGIDEAAVG